MPGELEQFRDLVLQVALLSRLQKHVTLRHMKRHLMVK
jgi:hypothetical protein